MKDFASKSLADFMKQTGAACQSQGEYEKLFCLKEALQDAVFDMKGAPEIAAGDIGKIKALANFFVGEEKSKALGEYYGALATDKAALDRALAQDVSGLFGHEWAHASKWPDPGQWVPQSGRGPKA